MLRQRRGFRTISLKGQAKVVDPAQTGGRPPASAGLGTPKQYLKYLVLMGVLENG